MEFGRIQGWFAARAITLSITLEDSNFLIDGLVISIGLHQEKDIGSSIKWHEQGIMTLVNVELYSCWHQSIVDLNCYKDEWKVTSLYQHKDDS